MDKKKPSLMIAVLEGLKKKGKMDSSADSSMKRKNRKIEELEEDDSLSYREHLEQVSKELIMAVHDEDHMAVADLLEEAFDCLDAAPHVEGPHLGEDEDDDKY